MSLIQQKIL